MNTTKHSSEPWEAHGDTISNKSISIAHIFCIGNTEESKGVRYYPESRANGERIVACVNACKGMDDPEKEIAALRAEINRLRNPAPTPTIDDIDFDSKN